MTVTRIVQLFCLLVAGFLFVSITGILPEAMPAIESAKAQVILPTARVVISQPAAPVVTYVTATPAPNTLPADLNEVVVIIVPEETAVPADTVGIDDRMLGPIDPVAANKESWAINNDPNRRVECTRAEWEKRTKENYPQPSGCTIVVD